jgi:cysteine-rich repeat protein
MTAIAGLAVASAGTPDQLLQGEAPVLFSGAEGEDLDSTLLADGSPIRGDEIWLWVPALTAGEVDLGTTGQFFKIWDSGPEAGPDGNDDDDNGMRGMDFVPATGTFLISYEDSTTTGFAFGNILDGDLMELSPTTVTDGFVTAFTLTRVYSECANGTSGCIGTGDLNALSLAGDGTLYWGCGATQTVQTDVPGSLSVGASTLLHADGITGPSPTNLGPNKFFEPTVSGCGVIFCPSIFTGGLRGVDVLDSGLVTFGVEGDYRNTEFTGPIDGLSDSEAEALAIGLQIACEKADICMVPNLGDIALNTFQQRTAEVLYAGSLFFQSPNVGDAEVLDHDILDSADEINALIAVLGVDSDAATALAAFVPSVAVCGDGVIDAGEACDDGNTVNADCCSSLCAIEAAGTVCRPQNDLCDLEETCDGSIPTCPADACLPELAECDGPLSNCVACTCELVEPVCFVANDCDLNEDGVRDDNCEFVECSDSACVATPIVYADMGGAFGVCPPDGFSNIHDRNHALSCFAGTNPCDSINIDAGGAFGACPPDGFCNIHDANHALASFAGTSTCSCPSGPVPEFEPHVAGHAKVVVVQNYRSIAPGSEVQARVFLEGPVDRLRGYQLEANVSGGDAGILELIGIDVERRKDDVFGDRNDTFDAFNPEGRMLRGLGSEEGVAVLEAYLATFTYRASKDASGQFVIDLTNGDDAQTYLVANGDGMIEITGTVPAIVTVTNRR